MKLIPNRKMTPVQSATAKTETGTQWQYDYFVQTYKSTDDTTFFGIKAEKRSVDGELVEVSDTFAITQDRERVEEIIAFLAKGSVPPCTLVEMVNEWFYDDLIEKPKKPEMPPHFKKKMESIKRRIEQERKAALS